MNTNRKINPTPLDAMAKWIPDAFRGKYCKNPKNHTTFIFAIAIFWSFARGRFGRKELQVYEQLDFVSLVCNIPGREDIQISLTIRKGRGDFMISTISIERQLGNVHTGIFHLVTGDQGKTGCGMRFLLNSDDDKCELDLSDEDNEFVTYLVSDIIASYASLRGNKSELMCRPISNNVAANH